MEGNQEREFMMTFRNYNDRLENIRGFRKGLNPFLLNGSLLGLKVKWYLGDIQSNSEWDSPSVTLEVPQLRPARPLCFPVSSFSDAFALRSVMCLSVH